MPFADALNDSRLPSRVTAMRIETAQTSHHTVTTRYTYRIIQPPSDLPDTHYTSVVRLYRQRFSPMKTAARAVIGFIGKLTIPTPPTSLNPICQPTMRAVNENRRDNKIDNSQIIKHLEIDRFCRKHSNTSPCGELNDAHQLNGLEP